MVLEDLQSVKRIIIAQGWTQGRYIADDGSVCLSEALYRVSVAESNRYFNMADAILREVNRGIPLTQHFLSISAWNDQRTTTHEIVMTALDNAIDNASS